MKNTSDNVMTVKKDLSTLCNSFFATLSNPTRLDIIEALQEQPKHVNQIAAELNQEQSMISHNLRQLVQCHLVNVRRKGRQRIYTLNHVTVDPLIKIIEDHIHEFCQDSETCNPRQISGD